MVSHHQIALSILFPVAFLRVLSGQTLSQVIVAHQKKMSRLVLLCNVQSFVLTAFDLTGHREIEKARWGILILADSYQKASTE